MIKPETLCFHCDNFNCNWRKNAKSVPGWNICPTQVKSGKNYLPSCIVMHCPEFRRQLNYANDDEWRRIQNNKKRTVYHPLADIYTLFPELKALILETQEHHEAALMKHEQKYKELQEKYLHVCAENERLTKITEQMTGVDKDAAV